VSVGVSPQPAIAAQALVNESADVCDRSSRTAAVGSVDRESAVDSGSGLTAVSSVQSSDSTSFVRIMPLKSMKVVVDNKPLNAMIDSGSQVVLLNKALLPDAVCIVGDIRVQGVFGDSVTADIAPVDVKRCNDDADVCGICMSSESMQILCGLVDNLASGYDMILPVEIADELSSLPLFDVTTATPYSVDLLVDRQYTSDDIPIEDEEYVVDVDAISDALIVDDVSLTCVNIAVVNDNDTDSDCDTLINEQQNGVSLANCRALAKAGKGNFVYRNGVLYRGDRIFGQRIWQLVVPTNKREQVLKLAHEQGAHLGTRKTSERIRLSFWWNGLKDDVQKYISSCHACQLRRRLRASDHVPIVPIPRATRPFEMIVIDVIGPIEPPGGPQKFKYVLCIVDSFTCFASAYLLKDLTAKSTCQALLEFFSWAGVSSVIVCDNGTNFNNSLTKELTL